MTVLRSGAATDVGRVRRNNQDHYLDEEPLFAVADGMGGAAGGEEASQTAVAALKATFENDPSADGLADGVREANRAVWEKARQHPELRGMGTTMTAIALVENEQEGEVLAIVNVGDSRVYLLRDGELRQVTEDHSVPEELRRAGRLTAEEAAVHPQRNVLTRALGIDFDVEVDCERVIPYKGDRLVLASDGLFNEVDHDGIASVARRQRDPAAAAAELVEMAKEGGGNDNITVVIVDVVDDDDRAKKASASVTATQAAPAARTRSQRAAASAGQTGRPAAGGGRGRARTGPPAANGITQAQPAAGAPAARPAASPSGAVTAGPPPFRPPPPPVTDSGGRRITLRVVAFLLALVLVLAGAVAAVGFFARAGYYVGVEGEEVVIYKGRPGGLLWFNPTVEERTGTSLSELRPFRAQDLRDGKEEPSLDAARRYVANLEEEAAPPTTTSTTIVAPVPPTPPPETAVPLAPTTSAP